MYTYTANDYSTSFTETHDNEKKREPIESDDLFLVKRKNSAFNSNIPSMWYFYNKNLLKLFE